MREPAFESVDNLLEAYKERGAMIAHLSEKAARLERENQRLRTLVHEYQLSARKVAS